MNHQQNIHDEALRLHRQGNIREALYLYNKILENGESDPVLYHLLGTAHLQIGQVRQAVDYLRMSIAMNANDAVTHNMLGIALSWLDRDEEALSSFDIACSKRKEYVDAYLNKGIAQGKLGRFDEALCSFDRAISFDQVQVQNVLFNKLMNVSQNPSKIRKLFLSLITKKEREPRVCNSVTYDLEKANDGDLIFGLGTGRNGSTSLTYLFKAQYDTYYSHEHIPIVPWVDGKSEVEFHIDRMGILSKMYRKVVDVSHWWLPYVAVILNVANNAKFVCMQRDRDETVNSFLKIKGWGYKGSINHWTNHDGSYFQKNAWDSVYPKYDKITLKDALINYWDDYYEQAETLQAKYPENFRIFNITDLQNEDGQLEILDFCRYDRPAPVNRLHKNAGGVSDSISLRMPYEYHSSGPVSTSIFI